MSEPSVQVVQWFNAARRIPILIGKLPSGEQIWGGPYRASQAITAGVVLLIGFATRGVWGGLVAGPGLMGTIVSALVCVGVAIGCGFLAGRLPLGANPLLEVAVAGPQVARKNAGTWCGSAMQVGDTYRLRGGPRVLPAPPADAPTAAAPPPVPGTRENAVPVARRGELAARRTQPVSTPPAMSPAQKLAALMENR